MMQRTLGPSAVVPRGFDVKSALCDGATTVITVSPTSDTSLYPAVQVVQGGSIADISAADLPLAGGRFAALQFCAVDVFSPIASVTALWRRRRGERRGSIWSSMT